MVDDGGTKGIPTVLLHQLRPIIKGFIAIAGGDGGFEPSIQVCARMSFSRGVPSTSRPRLRKGAIIAFSARPVKPKTRLFGLVEAECLCAKTRTANSRYFSSMTTEILISEVEIIWMLIPSEPRAENILLATPGCERMPTPTAETLQVLVSPTTPRAPSCSAMPLSIHGAGIVPAIDREGEVGRTRRARRSG